MFSISLKEFANGLPNMRSIKTTNDNFPNHFSKLPLQIIKICRYKGNGIQNEMLPNKILKKNISLKHTHQMNNWEILQSKRNISLENNNIYFSNQLFCQFYWYGKR